MRTYRELFGIREFRVLFTTTSLNVAAGSVGSLALGTLTYEETGSPLLAAFVMFGGPLVRLATSWFLLSLADLWRPRTAMMVSAGLMAAGDAAQAIPDLPMTARLVLLVVALGAALGDRRQHDGARLRDGARGLVRLRPRDDQHRGRRDADRGVRPRRPAPADLHHQPALPGGGGHVPGRAGAGAPRASPTTRRAPAGPPSAAAGRSTGCSSGRPCCDRCTSRCGCPTGWSSGARR